VLYRLFPHLPGKRPREEGGALHVPRKRQGIGRHDNPDHYGALYLSRDPESAIAERIQGFRGQSLTTADFRRQDGSRYALVALDDVRLTALVDLDDPGELNRRRIRPSLVATRNRTVTQPMALELYREGLSGFLWWSTLEASWSNATLFAERAAPRLKMVETPEPLTTGLPALRAAAEALGVRLA
jgi:hypothetical protein